MKTSLQGFPVSYGDSAHKSLIYNRQHHMQKWKFGLQVRLFFCIILVQNVLDLARKISTEFHAVFIGIQNQTDIHYAMPVRIMSTDAAGYYGQWKAIQKENRKTHTPKNSGEFLSGFSQTDTLLPIVTIVLYYGQKPWDGAVTLKEMLNLSGCPESLQKMIADYPINLFEIRNYPHLDRFQTDLQVVFGFLQNTNDKTQLVQYVHKHKDAFSHMKEDAYDLLRAMSNTKELKILSEQAEAQAICLS